MSYNDTVISTRIRLARNISGIAFPHRLANKEKLKVIEEVRRALLDSNSAIANDFTLINMWQISDTEALSLAEKHLISPDFAKSREGRALLLNKANTISIMINEEDHIRLQVIMPNFEPEKAFDLADKLDSLLNETLGFAFDEKLGYLTQCPTNLGTGLRASIMLHLPALQGIKAMPRISASLSKLGFTLRGCYGEGSDPKGAMYQLSNQVSLGISEKSAVDNLKNIAIQLINQERQERAAMLKSIDVQDGIARSLGILKYARSVSHTEAMQLLSNVRLGVVGGELNSPALELIDDLIIKIQPATLTKAVARDLSPAERDVERATLIRTSMNNV